MNLRRESLELLLRERGVLTAREMAEALNVSQPTMSRLLAGMGHHRLFRTGRGRAVRYGLFRPVRDLGSTWPLYRVDPDGRIDTVGRLCSLHARQWILDQEQPWDALRGSDFRAGLYPGLPWFIFDLRPQGFLGRCFARNHAHLLGSPLDPRQWNDDDIVAALIRFGDDLPGDLVLGEAAATAIQQRSAGADDAATVTDRAAEYPARAETVLAGGIPGSSAAGEQPKFTCRIREADGIIRHAIVKFSGAAGRAEDRRWADLLVAEHLANATLSEADVPCATTTLIEAGGRTFLESVRFDRVGTNGRRGLVSLEALDAAFFGRIETPWTQAAERLREDGWLSEADSDRLKLLWWFGMLIGNTDMHYGNVALFLAPDRPLSLAPTFDMVPMRYRPDVEGRLPSDPLNPAPPLPDARRLWSRAAGLASAFWSRLAETRLMSPPFRDLASLNARVVSDLRRRFGE